MSFSVGSDLEEQESQARTKGDAKSHQNDLDKVQKQLAEIWEWLYQISPRAEPWVGESSLKGVTQWV